LSEKRIRGAASVVCSCLIAKAHPWNAGSEGLSPECGLECCDYLYLIYRPACFLQKFAVWMLWGIVRMELKPGRGATGAAGIHF